MRGWSRPHLVEGLGLGEANTRLVERQGGRRIPLVGSNRGLVLGDRVMRLVRRVVFPRARLRVALVAGRHPVVVVVTSVLVMTMCVIVVVAMVVRGTGKALGRGVGVPVT